jgi:hypothetical protein
MHRLATTHCMVHVRAVLISMKSGTSSMTLKKKALTASKGETYFEASQKAGRQDG